MNRKKMMIEYSVIQGTYWMLFCAIYSFSTVFLLERGFTSTHIGLIMAFGNVLGVVLQPTFAALADNSGKVTVHRLTAMLAAAMLAGLAGLYVLPNVLAVVAVIFILTDALLQVLQPMVNSISVYYMNRGTDLNFGVARGFGSISFAVISSLLGTLVSGYGSKVILLTGIALLAVMIAVLALMPKYGAQRHDTAKSAGSAGTANGEEKAAGGFLGRYRYFTAVIIGLSLLMVSHNMINNYLIQIIEPLGGDSVSLGTTLSITAMLELPTMFFFSKLVKKISDKRLLMISGIFFFIKAASYLFITNMAQMYAAQIFQMGGFALYIPASVYYVNQVMKPQDTFKGQAMMAATSTLGGVFGGVLGGTLIDYANVRFMMVISTVIAFVGMILVYVYTPRVRAREDRTMPA